MNKGLGMGKTKSIFVSIYLTLSNMKDTTLNITKLS